MSKERIERSKFLPEKYKEVYKQDFERLLEEKHKKADEKISNVIGVLQSRNIDIAFE